MDKIDLTAVPLTPGVYLFKDEGGRIIYVGKAKHLRRRVASYFRPEDALTPKTRAMLRMARTVDTISTTSEKEALLLEASLIKKHRPRYNILLRDDKQYVLFKLTKRHAWPRLTLTRKVVRDGSAYFGPFTSAVAARETWKAIHAVFALRRCADRAFANRTRPCLYHYMQQCPAPCCLPVDAAVYREMVGKVEMLLRGRSSELLGILRAQMEEASENLAFEQAAVLRDQMAAITRTVERQAAVLPDARDMDVLGVAETPAGLALGLLFVRGGMLTDKRDFVWPGLGLEEAPEVLSSFLAQYYGPHSVIPERIVVPWAIDTEAAVAELSGIADVLDMPDMLAPDKFAPDKLDTDRPDAGGPEHRGAEADAAGGETMPALAEALSDLRGGVVRVGPPRNETENRLVSMAQRNAAESARAARGLDTASLLAARLGMAQPPVRIEAVDVSHTGGRNTRVGMVVFEDGRPAKDQYRTYAFADEDAGGDDYGVLAQWMGRRLESGPPWPDLLLIDGGKGQLAAVVSVLEREGAADRFAVAAIAKARSEDHGRADRRKGNVADVVYLPGRMNPVNMKAGSQELLFLQLVRDTVHDYSLRRHRKARAGSALSGELQRIPGVGPALAKALWAHFPTVRAMAEASEEELAAIPGIGRAKARSIRSALAAMRAGR
ncbi:excinuclease ABC subunit UvrC [Desulfovibrio psychrotolerans]|uniref:UvrABC system protein C n=1 Tax=Desulfovibrio psychrotolerans TaxID=415242 RepID=A0A7J0BTG2_9BACT|nr:excinuclease ABC subunit UvrC [Desulfovibrio psychrotolerans]GFM37010.1 UvrABC system protein C [Desulfovibrio psychrotolerans]